MSNTPKLHVVLYQPEIPHNTGNIGRTCVAVGAKLWLVQPLGFRMDNHHLRRAGLDYWEFLTWEIISDWQTLLGHLGGRQFWFFSKSAGREYTTASFRNGDVLVFGSETSGLPRSLLENTTQTLRIPMLEPVRSLNLANSVAIAVYEAVRNQ